MSFSKISWEKYLIKECNYTKKEALEISRDLESCARFYSLFCITTNSKPICTININNYISNQYWAEIELTNIHPEYEKLCEKVVKDYSSMTFPFVYTNREAERIFEIVKKDLLCEITKHNKSMAKIKDGTPVECCDCGKQFYYEELYAERYNGGILCYECYQNNYGYCNKCGKLHKYEDMNEDILCKGCQRITFEEVGKGEIFIPEDTNDKLLKFDDYVMFNGEEWNCWNIDGKCFDFCADEHLGIKGNL